MGLRTEAVCADHARMPELDGTTYCARRDEMLDIERCYACEWVLRYDHVTECGFDDVGPFHRISAAIQRSLKALRRLNVVS